MVYKASCRFYPHAPPPPPPLPCHGMGPLAGCVFSHPPHPTSHGLVPSFPLTRVLLARLIHLLAQAPALQGPRKPKMVQTGAQERPGETQVFRRGEVG